MSVTEAVIQKLRRLPPQQQEQVLHYVESLVEGESDGRKQATGVRAAPMARDTSLAAPTCRAGIRWRRESVEGGPTYVDNPDASGLVANKPEIREYKAVFVVGDVEVSQFSDEITVNCAPLV